MEIQAIGRMLPEFENASLFFGRGYKEKKISIALDLTRKDDSSPFGILLYHTDNDALRMRKRKRYRPYLITYKEVLVVVGNNFLVISDVSYERTPIIIRFVSARSDSLIRRFAA